MAKEGINYLRLGIFVTVGTALLLVLLYALGDKQDMFGKTFRLYTRFSEVNGLQKGNNVRFSGINVGTVRSIKIINDSTVEVGLRMEQEVQKFIRKNAMVSLGNEGLMGNKVIEIEPGTGEAPPVQDGDVLQATKSISTDDMLKTLNSTNENAKVVTQELSQMLKNVNRGEGTIGMLLTDKALVEDLRQTVANARTATQGAAAAATGFETIVRKAQRGDGTIGTLVSDTAMAGRLRQTMHNLQLTSQRTAAVSDSLAVLIEKVKSGKGAIGTAVNDTVLASNLKQSMHNIREITDGINDIMTTVRESSVMSDLKEQSEKQKRKKERKKHK